MLLLQCWHLLTSQFVDGILYPTETKELGVLTRKLPRVQQPFALFLLRNTHRIKCKSLIIYKLQFYAISMLYLTTADLGPVISHTSEVPRLHHQAAPITVFLLSLPI